MMKFLVLSALIVVATCSNVGRHYGSTSHYLSQNVTEMIMEEGYPVQNFTVQTSDGYVLDMIRIPGPAGNVQSNKPVVLLMHSLLSSAEEFVIGGRTQGLAYVLADAGFDVFIGNARGSEYGRKHTTLNPERDAAFWKFCWHDIGTKDLPAMIDDILTMTGQEKLFYVGHMQGTTAFFVLASERPEYNSRVEKMVSLGPVAYLGRTKNTLLRYVADNQFSVSWQMKNLGVNEFKPSQEVMNNAGQQDCISSGQSKNICENIYFLTNGYNSNDFNMTTINNMVSRVGTGASAKEIIHYANLVKTGRFDKYNPNVRDSNQEYDLTKISTPVSMIYAAEDMLSQEEDVNQLMTKLPHVVENIKLSQIKSNVDLLYCNNVDSVVYRAVINMLRSL